MKRLKRFNESKLEELDYDYIYQCFGELIDDGVASIKKSESDNSIAIRVNINDIAGFREHKSSIKDSPIYDYINSHRNNSNVLSEVETSLKRLSDKYPDYKIGILLFRSFIEINIYNSEDNKEEYPF
jgi:hypothetical protein